MSEENKAIVRRLFEEAWNQGKGEVIDEVIAVDHVDHYSPPGFPPGVEGFKQQLTMYRTAFPDIHFTIEDQVTEGDKVVTRWTARGTHQGELMGILATNKEATVTGIQIDRLAGGKIVEHWGIFDQLGLMQQLGVVPTMGEGGA